MTISAKRGWPKHILSCCVIMRLFRKSSIIVAQAQLGPKLQFHDATPLLKNPSKNTQILYTSATLLGTGFSDVA